MCEHCVLEPDKDRTRELEWVEFGHIPDKHFTDFREVDGIIRERTNKLCGPSGISSNAIVVKVFSPNVVPLTLVDLPGLTRVCIPTINLMIKGHWMDG
jgi:dynamin 1-like protein